MIHDYDRRYWFGASDGKYIFSDERSKSWHDWWDVKCGKSEQNFKGNIYTKAGNTFEHSILKAVAPNAVFDRQIIVPELKLRVNLDGNTEDEILEVKTYQYGKPFRVHDGYFYQAHLQMLAWNMESYINWVDCDSRPDLKKKNPTLKSHKIIAYGLYPDEYYGSYSAEDIEDGNIQIDLERIKVYEIKPSRSIQRKAVKTLRKLAKKLRKEEMK